MLRIELRYDPDMECPTTSDCAWTLYSFSRRHSTFKAPCDLGLGGLGEDGTPEVFDLDLQKKLEQGLAFWLSYFEHGNCLWFLRGDPAPPGVEFQWDGRRLAGLLVWEYPEDQIGAKTLEDRRADALAFLKEYTTWCNGEGLSYTIENEDGSVVDSCGGFLDAEQLCYEASAFLKGKEFIVTGEAAGLEDLLRDRVRTMEASVASSSASPDKQ